MNSKDKASLELLGAILPPHGENVFENEVRQASKLRNKGEKWSPYVEIVCSSSWTSQLVSQYI